MKSNRKFISIICVLALMVLLSSVNKVQTQGEQPKFFADGVTKNAGHIPLQQQCTGPISSVIDIGDESLRLTANSFLAGGGGGEGGCFDPNPLLTTNVNLANGDCLNAHLSAIVCSGSGCCQPPPYNCCAHGLLSSHFDGPEYR